MSFSSLDGFSSGFVVLALPFLMLTLYVLNIADTSSGFRVISKSSRLNFLTSVSDVLNFSKIAFVALIPWL